MNESNNKHDRLISCEKERDELIIKLWIALEELSNLECSNLNDDDINLWIAVTKHKAIQGKLLLNQRKQNDK